MSMFTTVRISFTILPVHVRTMKVDVIPSSRSSFGIVGDRGVQLEARAVLYSPCMQQCISCSHNIDLRLASWSHPSIPRRRSLGVHGGIDRICHIL